MNVTYIDYTNDNDQTNPKNNFNSTMAIWITEDLGYTSMWQSVPF